MSETIIAVDKIGGGSTETITSLTSKTGITSNSNASLSIDVTPYKKLRIVICEANPATKTVLCCEDIPFEVLTALNSIQLIVMGEIESGMGLRLYVNFDSNRTKINGTQYFTMGTVTYLYEYYIYGIK